MASTATEHTSTCLVCYKMRPLKIVGNCKHSFCTECLSTVFESLDSGFEVLACPTCKVDCPRPWDGVKGLVDFTGKDAGVAAVAIPKPERDQQDGAKVEGLPDESTDITAHKKCQTCLYKKKDTPAVNLCVACGNLHICGDCTKFHAKNKATQGHLIVALKTQGRQCEKHNSVLDSYCLGCKKAVCMICVMLEHGDHAVEKLECTIESKHDEVQVILEKQEKKLHDLQCLKYELSAFLGEAPLLDKQDTLIKEIEDHAQKCIDQIVKWKEDLKTQVKEDFKIIRDVPIGLGKVSEVVQRLQEVVESASKLLRETEHHPVYLDKLIALQQELGDIDGIGDNVEGKEFRKQFHELHESNYSFVPKDIPTTLGEVLGQERPSREFQPKKIFTKTLQVNSKDMFIPCVANLGKMFAVANPTKEGEYSNAIDIYEFPGTLIKTLRDHVPPIYDMSSTPDGKLAVLSNGTVDSSSSVQLFDPETGYIRSTCDITDVTKPLSLGVTLQNQYVILGDNDQVQREITVVDKDGAVLHTHLIEARVTNPNRITCGGRLIFVKGDEHVAVFEIKDTGLLVIQTGTKVYLADNFKDISATVWDDFIVTNIWSGGLYMVRYRDKENTLKWSCDGCISVSENVTEIEKEGRLSVRHGHIVVSHGQAVRVYKL